MTISEDDERLSFMPLEVAVVPPAGLIEHIKDHWWQVHPTKGLLFWRKHSAQCNSSEAVSRSINPRMYPWAEVRFIPSVFRRIDPHDYV